MLRWIGLIGCAAAIGAVSAIVASKLRTPTHNVAAVLTDVAVGLVMFCLALGVGAWLSR